MRKIKLFIFSVVLPLFFTATPVFAQSYGNSLGEQHCGGENPASAIILLPADTYDIYAKLGTKDKTESASLSVQSLGDQGNTDSCKAISAVQINDVSFTKMGNSVVINAGPSFCTLLLSLVRACNLHLHLK